MRLERLVRADHGLGARAARSLTPAFSSSEPRPFVLYHFLFPLARQYHGPERLQVHLVPRGGRGGHGAAAVVHRRADHPARAAHAVGAPGRARRHARLARRQGHDADDGRPDHPLSALISIAALGAVQPAAPYLLVAIFVTLWMGVHRVPRRLPQAPAEAARARRTTGSSSATSSPGRSTIGVALGWYLWQHPLSPNLPGASTTLPFFKYVARPVDRRLRVAVRAVHDVHPHRHEQRREHHGRPRRPGGRAVGDRVRRRSRSSRTSSAASTTAAISASSICSDAGELTVFCSGDGRRAASGSSGSTRTRRRSSWATPARSRSAARSAPSRSCSSPSSCCVRRRGVRRRDDVGDPAALRVQVPATALRARVRAEASRLSRAPLHHHFEVKGGRRRRSWCASGSSASSARSSRSARSSCGERMIACRRNRRCGRVAARRDRRRRARRAAAAPRAQLLARAGARSTRRDCGDVAAARRRPRTSCARDGVDVELGRPRPRAHRARVARRREPRRAAGRAAVRRRARGRRRHRERDRDRAALPAELALHRRHRHERQDDHDRAHRPPARRRSARRASTRGQHRHAAVRARAARRRRRTGSRSSCRRSSCTTRRASSRASAC